MTIDEALTAARLKEVHALEHIRGAIVAHATDGAWTYVVSALDARLRELEALLQRDDPQVRRDCAETPAPSPALTPNDELPNGVRIH